jgi:hypothetical protein
MVRGDNRRKSEKNLLQCHFVITIDSHVEPPGIELETDYKIQLYLITVISFARFYLPINCRGTTL